MTIRAAQEIACDGCGQGAPDYGSRQDCVRHWKSHGWVFVGSKHFCDSDCLKEYNRKKSTDKEETPA